MHNTNCIIEYKHVKFNEQRRDKDMQSHSLDVSDLEGEKSDQEESQEEEIVENQEEEGVGNQESQEEERDTNQESQDSKCFSQLAVHREANKGQSGRPTGNVFVHGAYSSIKLKHAKTVIPLIYCGLDVKHISLFQRNEYRCNSVS